jgi:hypothetical protein
MHMKEGALQIHIGNFSNFFMRKDDNNNNNNIIIIIITRVGKYNHHFAQ